MQSPPKNPSSNVSTTNHLQHLQVLKEMARKIGTDSPTEGDMKQLLTTGKIALADLLGYSPILKAMKTNEDDTVTAYERASWHGSKAFFLKSLHDEQRHRERFETTSKEI